jgi:hypothetical protein
MFCVLSGNTNTFIDECKGLSPFLKGNILNHLRSSSKTFMALIAGARFFDGNLNVLFSLTPFPFKKNMLSISFDEQCFRPFQLDVCGTDSAMAN